VVQATPEQAGSGLIFHSDRGSQYASHDFRDVLEEYGIASSMSHARTTHLNRVGKFDLPQPRKIRLPLTLKRLNAEIKRRTNGVGTFPNDGSIVRLVGAMTLLKNDEWSLNRPYMQLEGLNTVSDTAPARLPAVAR